MKKNLLLSLLVVGSITSTMSAQEYTVDDLITTSLKNSPDIAISRASYEASQKRYDAAFSSYLPKIDLKLSGGVRSQDGGIIQDGPVNDTLLLGKLSASQLVYDFDKTGGTVDTRSFEVKSYDMDNKQQVSDKIKDVKTAYYDVLKAKSLIDVRNEDVKLNEAQVYRSQKYFDAGIRTKIDVSDAQVSLIKSKIALNNATYNLESTYANLDKVVGFTNTTRDYEVYYKEIDLDAIKEYLKQYNFSLKECVEYAYNNKAEVMSYKYQLEASKAQIESINAEYYPSIYLYGDYTKQKIDKLKQYMPQDTWQTSVNLDWNLYQGGSTNARKEEKVINADIAQSKLVFAQLRIKQSVTHAYINLAQKKDEVILSKSLVDVSSEKFDQASKRYENGLADFIELQQARQDYIDAKANLVNTFYDYYIAIAKLDNAIGK
ncbi:TolC family protein [Sulfurimonas sp.]|uniref:TolC family protein n=1 Tax=Sulfurimonas sp. TaxID=2022749 RepID=UPI003D0F49CC